MQSITTERLEEARIHFYAWRLIDAYHILKRYFDRLPFCFEKKHAEYIGMFVRCLFELGKEFDLKFYLHELEKRYAQTKDPWLAYTLAVVYFLKPPNESARELFESVLGDSTASHLHAKAKMMLADYYLSKGDISMSRALLDSLGPIADLHEQRLAQIWHAVIERRENKIDAAMERLRGVLRDIDSKKDWYSYLSALLVLALCHIDKGEKEAALRIHKDLKNLFRGRQFKATQIQLKWLDDKILEMLQTPSALACIFKPNDTLLRYQHKTVRLKGQASKKLLQLLVKKRAIDKATIVRNLYRRSYLQGDDAIIYYHIHTLRKRLERIGLPRDTILHEANGYRFVKNFDIITEENL